eukprot:scaffold344215_cov31-Prasinocladus_malaysianus.AAC.1
MAHCKLETRTGTDVTAVDRPTDRTEYYAYPPDELGEVPKVLALMMGKCYGSMGEESAQRATEAGLDAKKIAAEVKKLEQRLSELSETDTERFQLKDRLYALRSVCGPFSVVGGGLMYTGCSSCY